MDCTDIQKLLKEYNYITPKNGEFVTIEDLGVEIHNNGYLYDVLELKQA